MRIRKIHAGAFIAASCVMIAVMHWIASGNARTEKSPSGSLAIFENERAYLRHIETKVRFRNITLSIVEVQGAIISGRSRGAIISISIRLSERTRSGIRLLPE
jgi:hypothetical protein